MKHDIHDISNELYTQRQRSIQEKENRERKKRYLQDLKYTLQEEIDNFIHDNDTGSINDIQLKVLDNQNEIIDFASQKIIDKEIYKAKKIQVNLDLKEIFLKEFNVVFKEYKTRYKIQKEKDKENKKDIYNDILNKLIDDFDYLNNQRRYDMKIVLKNMYSEDYKQDVFIQLLLNNTSDNEEMYYKALRELKRRKKDAINEVRQKDIKTNSGIPLSWKCYGVLKVINKMLK